MKKARIMLAAIALMGIIGGTLAFKAQKYFTGDAFYGTTTSTAGRCFAAGPYTTSTLGVTTTIILFTKTTTATNQGPFYTVVSGSPVYCIDPAAHAYFTDAE